MAPQIQNDSPFSILLSKLKLNEQFMADYTALEIDEAVLAKSFYIKPELRWDLRD